LEDTVQHDIVAANAESPNTRLARWRRHLKRFFAHPLNCISTLIIITMLLMAVFAPLIAPYHYSEVNTAEQWQGSSAKHWLGTDQYGRDILSRVIYGSQISLLVGFTTVCLAMLIGVTVGSISGYFGGKIDEIIMRVVEVFMAIPGIVLALAIVSVLGPSILNVIIAISIYRVTQFARVTRGSFLSVMAMDYIEACRAQGMGNLRIMFLHALPNCIGPIVVLATVLMGNVILSEATLSFLGLGIQPPLASWGVMIKDGNEYLMFAPWMSVWPGVFLLITMMAFNLLGDGLRDHLDPRGRSVL
jgi:peptide/nickel transport system permease protein